MRAGAILSKVLMTVLANVVCCMGRMKLWKVAVANVTRENQEPEGMVPKKKPLDDEQDEISYLLMLANKKKSPLQGSQEQPQRLHHAGTISSWLPPKAKEVLSLW